MSNIKVPEKVRRKMSKLEIETGDILHPVTSNNLISVSLYLNISSKKRSLFDPFKVKYKLS